MVMATNDKLRETRGNPLPPPRFLTARQLARRWAIGLTSAYRYAESGLLPVFRIGGSVRFPLSAVERFESEHVVGGER